MYVLTLEDLKSNRCPRRSPLTIADAIVNGIIDGFNLTLQRSFLKIDGKRSSVVSADFRGHAYEEYMQHALVIVKKVWPYASLDETIITVTIPSFDIVSEETPAQQRTPEMAA